MTADRLERSPQAPTWPKVVAVVKEDGSANVTVNGTSHPVHAADVDQARVSVIELVREQTAAVLGRPVRVDTTDPTGQWQLIVHPDGQVDEVDAAAPAQRRGGHALSRRLALAAAGAVTAAAIAGGIAVAIPNGGDEARRAARPAPSASPTRTPAPVEIQPGSDLVKPAAATIREAAARSEQARQRAARRRAERQRVARQREKAQRRRAQRQRRRDERRQRQLERNPAPTSPTTTPVPAATATPAPPVAPRSPRPAAPAPSAPQGGDNGSGQGGEFIP